MVWGAGAKWDEGPFGAAVGHGEQRLLWQENGLSPCPDPAWGDVAVGRGCWEGDGVGDEGLSSLRGWGGLETAVFPWPTGWGG